MRNRTGRQPRRKAPEQSQTVRLCMLEVVEAIAGRVAGQVVELTDYVHFQLYPTIAPKSFLKTINVVPRRPICDVADYAIGLRLFHEAENHA